MPKLFDINMNQVVVSYSQKDYPIRDTKTCKSKFQYEVGQILLDKYKFYVILEEWTVPGTGLRLDFFIPQRGIAVEVDGQQHDNFSKFFHGTKENFDRQKRNDAIKEKWCEINDFVFYRIKNLEEAKKI